jgi:hypothetical protein
VPLKLLDIGHALIRQHINQIQLPATITLFSQAVTRVVLAIGSMDYESEQAMEMEALESILMDDLQPYEGTTPAGWGDAKQVYKANIRPPEDIEDEDDMQPAMELLFAHTKNYPDEAPHFKVRSVRGLSDQEISQVQALLQEQVEQNLGMAMIYTLLSAAQEWFQNRQSAPAAEDPEEARKRADAEEEARRAAARAHGHMVTLEIFVEWKRKFDAEMALAKAALKDVTKDEKAGSGLTGKQWFMQSDGLISEKGTEAGALSDDDEDDFSTADDDEDNFEGDDDDSDDEMLEEYLATKA